jgi:protein AbiQ
MIKFYDVENDYIQYLKNYDRKVPDVLYNNYNKFICGIVFKIGEINFYAPISHSDKIQRTNLPIYDKGKIISTIKFCFMFPAPMSVLTEKNFKSINNTDPNYANLLSTEYNYCKSIIDEILKKASSVYKMGCNPNHVFYNECCKFKILEEAYKKYIINYKSNI